MNGDMTMEKNKLINMLMWGGAALSLVLAIISVVFAVSAETTYVKIMLFIAVALFILRSSRTLPACSGRFHTAVPRP